MAAVDKTQNADQVVQAVVKYFGEDFKRVRDFYHALDPAMRGINPEIDALIDGLDNWLIGQWPSVKKYGGLDWDDLVALAVDFDP